MAKKTIRRGAAHEEKEPLTSRTSGPSLGEEPGLRLSGIRTQGPS